MARSCSMVALGTLPEQNVEQPFPSDASMLVRTPRGARTAETGGADSARIFRISCGKMVRSLARKFFEEPSTHP
jgi:hypothetical protein